jgi:hypothetical protein
MKKTAQNDVTGDWIQSKPNSDQFGEGWDRIFGKKKKEESRIDVVGQNGNDGLHYTYELNKSTGEVEKVEDGTTTSTQE